MAFRSDRPREVEFATFSAPVSAAMDSLILTATMGNYGLLRALRLADGPAIAAELWPKWEEDPNGFAPPRVFPLDRLVRTPDGVIVAAEPIGAAPADGGYDPAVDPWWRYSGLPAVQYWRVPGAPPGLKARVNARAVYYGQPAAARIPGGPAFENFELEAPFAASATFIFGVRPWLPGT